MHGPDQNDKENGTNVAGRGADAARAPVGLGPAPGPVHVGSRTKLLFSEDRCVVLGPEPVSTATPPTIMPPPPITPTEPTTVRTAPMA